MQVTPFVRVRMLGCGLLVAGWIGFAFGEEAPVGRALLAGSATRLEAAMAAPVLAQELEQLRERVEQLDLQVSELTVLLAEARMALDRLQVERDHLPELRGQAGESVSGQGARHVVEANRDLSLVVLDGGVAAGIRPGMIFAVVRDSNVVARVRAVDVRETISAARIETVVGDVYPQTGDRLVIWRSSTE